MTIIINYLHMQYRTLLITLCGFILPTVLVFGQSGRITGKVIENDSKQTMTGVYVKLRNAVDSSTLEMVMTDKDGNFSFSGLMVGIKVIVTTSFLGYSDVNIAVVTQYGMKDLGVISLVSKAQAIG